MEFTETEGQDAESVEEELELERPIRELDTFGMEYLRYHGEIKEEVDEWGRL